MTRPKRDSFDDLADFLRKRPVWAYRAGRVLNIIFGPAFYTKDPKVTPEEVFRMLGEIQKLEGADAVGGVLEEAALAALSPKRGRGRPPKETRPVDVMSALETRVVRTQLDAVTKALKSGLEEHLEKGSRPFAPKRARELALNAMKRFHEERLVRGRLRTGRRSVPVDRLRVLAARVVLESRGLSATTKDGAKLLKAVQNRAAIAAAELSARLGVGYALNDEKAQSLLARLDAAEAKAGKK